MSSSSQRITLNHGAYGEINKEDHFSFQARYAYQDAARKAFVLSIATFKNKEQCYEFLIHSDRKYSGKIIRVHK